MVGEEDGFAEKPRSFSALIKSTRAVLYEIPIQVAATDQIFRGVFPMSFRLREMEEQRKKKLLQRSIAVDKLSHPNACADGTLYSTLTDEQKIKRAIGTIELFKKHGRRDHSQTSRSGATPVNLTSRKQKITAAHRENLNQKEYEAVLKTYDLTRQRQPPAEDRAIQTKTREKMRVFLRENYFVKVDLQNHTLRSHKQEINRLQKDYRSTDLGETDMTANNINLERKPNRPGSQTAHKMTSPRLFRINPAFMKTFHSTLTSQARAKAFLLTEFEKSLDSRDRTLSIKSKSKPLLAASRMTAFTNKMPDSLLKVTLYSADETNTTAQLQTTDRTFHSFKPHKDRSSHASRSFDKSLQRKTFRLQYNQPASKD